MGQIRNSALNSRRMIPIARKRLSECLSPRVGKRSGGSASSSRSRRSRSPAATPIRRSIPPDRRTAAPNDADCNPYNPISYAQNNTGIGGGGH